MSISGTSGISANGDTHQGAFDIDAGTRALDLRGEPESGGLSDVSTTGDLLTEKQTDLDKLVGLPSTLERLSGSLEMYPKTEPLGDPIVLAQSTSLFPDPVMQELQQQLQPLQNRLEGVLGEPKQPDLPGQAALDLISEHRETIVDVASQYGVDPMQVASIIFQEKFHGNWADAKNVVGAWPQVLLGANDASIGLAEMDVNTAARLMDIDPATMSSQQRDDIIDTLSDDGSAIGLIAANIASFEARLGREVTLQEATYGHNAGIEALVQDLPIERGSAISRRSWDHQDSITSALGLL